MMNFDDLPEADRKAIQQMRDRLAAIPDTPEQKLRKAFYQAAYETLRKGAPGLSDLTCGAIAQSIALKCVHAAKTEGATQ